MFAVESTVGLTGDVSLTDQATSLGFGLEIQPVLCVYTGDPRLSDELDQNPGLWVLGNGLVKENGPCLPGGLCYPSFCPTP